MVKLTIKLDNNTYATLAQMSIDSGLDINDLIKLFIINRTEDYLENGKL